ncbi:MAG: histidine kinase dimerization/phosphoacceptor domain -containing protein [Balneolaceae bacterium]
MKVQGNTSQTKFQEQVKRQSILFNYITNLDEQALSLAQLLQKASDIISIEWLNGNSISVLIEFNKQVFKSANFKRTSRHTTSGILVRKGKKLSVRIFSLEEHSFTEAEQQLVDVIANNLSAKINRKLAQQDLQENQELLDKAYKLARIGTWEYDMINEKLHWSAVTKEVHGFDEDYEPDVESTVNLFKEGYHRDSFAKAANNAIEFEIPFDVELKIISGKGDERWIRATGEPEYKDGVCIRFYGISQNVTLRRQAEEEVELNDRRFKALVQHGMDMIAILDNEANYKFVSPTSLNVLGFPPDYFSDKNAFDLIHEDDKPRIFKQFSNLGKNETTQLKPFRFAHSAGDWRWLESTITNLTDDPAVQGFVVNSRDVTARQIKQEQIIDSLKEKETLLAEIHHRVKNNLSVLTGLLQLQANKESNDEVLERLLDSVARIHTMASIHEQLYQTKNFSSIEFADRIQLLAIDIQKTFQLKNDVELNFQCEPIELSLNKALPCSLIVNEVLTNIFKHAFKGRDKGKITIEIKKTEEANRANLTISDNGNGLPDDFDPNSSNSLGLTLIHMLAQQLPAEYTFESDKNGTSFSLLLNVD